MARMVHRVLQEVVMEIIRVVLGQSLPQEEMVVKEDRVEQALPEAHRTTAPQTITQEPQEQEEMEAEVEPVEKEAASMVAVLLRWQDLLAEAAPRQG
ncbi:MAG: hypothetical protein EB023_04835 [Flavobacteriia bacterium]|nr:hypothetical protein [Flavobacteriia bacterium]